MRNPQCEWTRLVSVSALLWRGGSRLSDCSVLMRKELFAGQEHAFVPRDCHCYFQIFYVGVRRLLSGGGLSKGLCLAVSAAVLQALPWGDFDFLSKVLLHLPSNLFDICDYFYMLTRKPSGESLEF